MIKGPNMNPTHCPYCKTEVDTGSPLDPEERFDRKPSPGAISLCFYCGKVGVYTDILKIRPITEGEPEDMKIKDPDNYQMLMRASFAIQEGEFKLRKQ